jgi:hypothetical protein
LVSPISLKEFTMQSSILGTTMPVLEFALGAELHQPADGEGDAGDFRLGLGLDLANDPARLLAC